MKKKELTDLRKKDIATLTKEVEGLRAERDKALSDRKAGKESNLKRVKGLKVTIAQYLTIINEQMTRETEVK